MQIADSPVLPWVYLKQYPRYLSLNLTFKKMLHCNNLQQCHPLSSRLLVIAGHTNIISKMTEVQSLAKNPRGAASESAQVLVITASARLHNRIKECIGTDVRVKILHKELCVDGVTAYRRYTPDVVILDVDGQDTKEWLVTITRLRKIDRHAMIIMISARSIGHNASAYTDGLARGATDFLAVPTTNDDETAKKAFQWKLNALVHAFTIARRQLGPPSEPVRRDTTNRPPKPRHADATAELRPYGKQKPKALAIASSTGGPRALMAVFSVLPRDIKLPIFITQHMPIGFTASLAENITTNTDWPCHEGVDGMEALPGCAYLAPGGFHMELESGTLHNRIRITDSKPENFCKPSADPMLRSLVDIYGAEILLTVLTGMGADGLAGAKQVVAAGGTVIAQDQNTSVVWGMPGAVATNGLCSSIQPIDAMAGEIAQIIKGLAYKP
jgi:two-component system, chemotaxis family, protein-glutamate methylesterase/glutaminase